MFGRLILLLILFGMVTACRPVPFKVEKLSTTQREKVESHDQDLERNLESVVDSSLGDRYRQKKSPSFALINGYYKLPEARPYGAALIVKSYSYRTSFEAVSLEKNHQAYAITPVPADDALVLQKALNSLLDIGVKIKEISMADALSIAKAEQAAMREEKTFLLGSVMPPDVDYLMSIYPSSSSRGPVLVGRVVSKDGVLMAFRVIHRGSNPQLMGSLITSLFEDTINRI